MTRHPDRPDGDIVPAETIAPIDAPVVDENFLSRWARRKQAAATGTPLPEESPELPANPVATVPEPSAEEPVVEKTDADMPPLESLNADSDYSGFMSPKVSAGLRRLALRKLFHSATFNVVDGLDDYDDDFRNFAPLGDIITADMRHNAELEAERERERLAKEDATREAAAEAEAAEETQSAAADSAEDEVATEEDDSGDEVESLAETGPAPKNEPGHKTESVEDPTRDEPSGKESA